MFRCTTLLTTYACRNIGERDKDREAVRAFPAVLRAQGLKAKGPAFFSCIL